MYDVLNVHLELTSKDHLFLLQPSDEAAGCSEGSAQHPPRLRSARSSSAQLHLHSCLCLCRCGEAHQTARLFGHQACERGTTPFHKGFPVLTPLDTWCVMRLSKAPGPTNSPMSSSLRSREDLEISKAPLKCALGLFPQSSVSEH